MAIICNNALVDPAIAACTIIAFSNASLVRIFPAESPCSIRYKTCFPALRASLVISKPVESANALVGRAIPNASLIICIVQAVPIKAHAPGVGQPNLAKN